MVGIPANRLRLLYIDLTKDRWYRSVRRRAHDTPDAILIADAADLAVGKIDFDHILRRADQAHGLVGMSVEYLGSVIAVLVGRDIGVVAFDVEGQPMRPVAAFHADPLRQDRGHRVAHAPYLDVRVARAAARPRGRRPCPCGRPGWPVGCSARLAVTMRPLLRSATCIPHRSVTLFTT